MIRLVLALAIAAMLGRAACAETRSAAPRLKELVTVSAEIVRIGDLVENAGMAADVPVFRAPRPGPDRRRADRARRRRAAPLRHRRTRYQRAQRGGGDAVVTSADRRGHHRPHRARLRRAIRLRRRAEPRRDDEDAGPRSSFAATAWRAGQAVGLAAKVALRSGQALRTDDLIKPQVVQRNESVTIYYEVPGILLTVRGKALEAGAVGDVVGVLNIQSNRPVQATVIAPGRVSIAAAGPLIATAAAPETDDPSPPRTQ